MIERERTLGDQLGGRGPNRRDGQRSPKIGRRPQRQGEEPRQPVGAFTQALEVSRHDSQLDTGVGVGPRGGLLEVGQGHVPLTKLHVGSGAAEIGFGELGVASQGQRPFLDRRLDAAQRVERGRLVKMDSVLCAPDARGVEVFECARDSRRLRRATPP